MRFSGYPWGCSRNISQLLARPQRFRRDHVGSTDCRAERCKDCQESRQQEFQADNGRRQYPQEMPVCGEHTEYRVNRYGDKADNLHNKQCKYKARYSADNRKKTCLCKKQLGRI